MIFILYVIKKRNKRVFINVFVHDNFLLIINIFRIILAFRNMIIIIIVAIVVIYVAIAVLILFILVIIVAVQ